MGSPSSAFKADPTVLASSAASSSTASDTRTPPGSTTGGAPAVKPGRPKGVVAHVKEFNRLWHGLPPKYESSFLVHKVTKTKRDSVSGQPSSQHSEEAGVSRRECVRDACDGLQMIVPAPRGACEKHRLVVKDVRSGKFYYVTAAPVASHPPSPEADMEWLHFLNDFGDLSPRAEAAQQADMAREWGGSKDKAMRDMSNFELFRDRRSSMLREIDEMVNNLKCSRDAADTQATQQSVSNKLASLRGLKPEDMLKGHGGSVF